MKTNIDKTNNNEEIIAKTYRVKKWLERHGWDKVRKCPDRIAAESGFNELLFELMDELKDEKIEGFRCNECGSEGTNPRYVIQDRADLSYGEVAVCPDCYSEDIDLGVFTLDDTP